MRFAKGNKAAASPSKKAVAAMIKKRLDKDADSLSSKEFTDLTSQYTTLTKPRRRRQNKPRNEKVNRSGLDSLPPAEAEMLREILRVEAEQLEARRKKWIDESKEQPTPAAEIPSVPEYTHKIWTNVLDH